MFVILGLVSKASLLPCQVCMRQFDWPTTELGLYLVGKHVRESHLLITDC